MQGRNHLQACGLDCISACSAENLSVETFNLPFLN